MEPLNAKKKMCTIIEIITFKQQELEVSIFLLQQILKPFFKMCLTHNASLTRKNLFIC